MRRSDCFRQPQRKLPPYLRRDRPPLSWRTPCRLDPSHCRHKLLEPGRRREEARFSMGIDTTAHQFPNVVWDMQRTMRMISPSISEDHAIGDEIRQFRRQAGGAEDHLQCPSKYVHRNSWFVMTGRIKRHSTNPLTICADHPRSRVCPHQLSRASTARPQTLNGFA